MGGMAKKKSGTQKKKSAKNSQGGALEQLKRVKWYMWVLIALTVYFGGLYTFKYFATQHDIKLLDEAEAKMRQLDFGDATSVEYSRSCSVRSVKYGDPGRPTCGIDVTAVFKETNINNKNTELFKESLLNVSSTEAKTYREDATEVYADVDGYIDGLECYYGDLNSRKPGDDRQNIFLRCQKKFWKQVYPED